MNNLIVQNPWILAAGLFIALAASVGYYWKDKKFSDIKRLWIYFLAFLRFMAIFLLFLLLTDIIIKSAKHIRKKPIIIWLQDNSQSIKLATDSSYLIQYRQILNQTIKQLSSDYQVYTFLFDKELKSGLDPDFKGIYTNISGALQEIKQRYYNENIGLIILASDGIYNQGYDPSLIAKSSPYPIFTVLLGDTTEKKDLRITNIQANKIAYLHEKFPVQADIEAHFAQGDKTIAQVFLDNHLVAQKTINIDKQHFRKKILFYIKPTSAGKKLLTVKLRPISKENNIKNNHQTIVIDIINSKQKILILSAFPHPDIALLQRILKDVPTYQVKFSYLHKFKGDLKEYNLIILNQIPTDKYPSSALLKEISSQHKPVLIILGTKTNCNILNQLPIGINFTAISGSFDQAQPIFNQNFRIFIPNPQLTQLQDKLPPLIVPYIEFNKNIPDEYVLSYQKINNVPTQKPLILLLGSSPWNNNKLGIILGEGIWRWAMAEFRYNKDEQLTNNLFKQIIQYLLVIKQKKRFIVKVKPIIDQSEEIIFTAELYDKAYNPITEPEVKLIISDSTGKQFKYLMERRHQYYSVNIGRLPEGIYHYQGQTQFGKEIFSEKGSFAVKPVNIEALNLKANLPLLKKIALSSGGKFMEINDLSKLDQYIKDLNTLKTISLKQITINNLINQPIIFFIILLLITIEWILRKYFGNL